ncbi:MAG: adenylate/guanylate cyclase domain-containing protein [Pseudomonadota bacterium]
MVELLRRSRAGPQAAPDATTPREIETWLLTEAIAQDDLLTLVEGFVWRIVASGIPLHRASIHVGTLHPQLVGFAWNWEEQDGICDEVKVGRGSLKTDSYLKNPIFQVIEHGRTVHGDPRNPSFAEKYSIMATLAKSGITEYIAMPLRSSATNHNVATAGTRHPDGFGEETFQTLQRLFQVFALHVERHIAVRLAGNISDIYLGPGAAAQVLSGSIERGAGSTIDAVIWTSDMRGFTDLADKLDPADMIQVLNAYFERLAGAVMENGGEVLKFIGDGLLAVFPFQTFETEGAAAHAALTASIDATVAVERLNHEPTDVLSVIEGWRPLRSGIALHEGPVFFGNVGASDRLDFTVIGRAVNATSRVEALSKALDRSILISEPVAKRLDADLEHMGEHHLRGLAEPFSLFSPRL